MPIQHEGHLWVLQSGCAAYALGASAEGVLLHVHWGRALPLLADYRIPDIAAPFPTEHPLQLTAQEVVTGEASAVDERCLDGIVADGSIRGLVLRFVEAKVAEEGVAITLRDAALSLKVVLRYTVLDQPGLFSRWISVTNEGRQPFKLTRAFSGSFNLPDCGPFALTNLDGRWGDEFRIQRDPMPFGTVQRDSRRIITSHGGLPFFAIDRTAPGMAASEETGAVWFGALEWSGNWRLISERTRDDRTVVHLGLNDHDFAWDVQPGETFDTPRVIFGFTDGGFGAMSRSLHDLIRDDLAPRKDWLPPVVYNSWYATTFNVDQAGQTALAEKAAAMGVEMFVMDDGWFHGRVDDTAGLGDWWPDATKFPDGLGPLIDAVHVRGMGFGLWIEPEMVNPNSQLYAAHPDWVVHFPGRPRTEMRNQLLLNLGRRDVQDYLIDIFDRLLSENAIDFIKWDMNRSASEAGWPAHDRDQREIWTRYVHGLNRVWQTLRDRHPGVIWENCASGGGRVDLAMMRLTEQSWASDNTYAPARLLIQEGYSILFPAGTMAAWVTDSGDYPLDLRFHVSMAGAMGIGGNLLRWSDVDCNRAAQHVAHYKTLRPIIAQGDLYRILSAKEHAVSAFAYVAKDKSEAALFAFRMHEPRLGRDPNMRHGTRALGEGRLIPVPGLAPEAVYATDAEHPALSGTALAEVGLRISLDDFSSTVLHLRRQG
jgi:alpha-galactosidase